MKLDRRRFLQLGGATSAMAVAGTQTKTAIAAPKMSAPKWTEETATICPYCAVGCGMIVGTADGQVVNIEGDPDHPINQGALCSKGSALKGLITSAARITKPMYRAPHSDKWQEIEWDSALDQIAGRIKATRDEFWTEVDDQGRLVRRAEAIASVGSAALDNEECSLLVKALRSMGILYLEHQARI